MTKKSQQNYKHDLLDIAAQADWSGVTLTFADSEGHSPNENFWS